MTADVVFIKYPFLITHTGTPGKNRFYAALSFIECKWHQEFDDRLHHNSNQD